MTALSRQNKEFEVGRHGSAPTNRQHRWAARENTRRQAGYAARLDDWERTRAELDDLFRIAHGDEPKAVRWPDGGPPHTDPAMPTFVPRQGEQVLCRAHGVSLVRADRPAGSRGTGYGGYSALAAVDLNRAARPSAPDQPGAAGSEPVARPGRVSEPGSMTVTDQRVVFHGSPEQEWAWELGRLVLVEHSRTEPVTLLHVSDRESVTGLRYAGSSASVLRFALVLAVAQHSGDGERFRAALRTDRERHATHRPTPPPPARPEDAPGTTAAALDAARTGYARWRGHPPVRRVAELAGVAAAITLLVVLVASAQGAPSGGLAGPRPPAGPDVSPLLPATAQPTGRRAVPTGSVTPSDTASTASPSTSATASATATGSASTSTSTSLCGAPSNPFGYNLCGRGSPVNAWPAQVCSYFTCVAGFGESGGHLVECGDHTLSTSGAAGNGCARHRGSSQIVYGP